MSFVLPLPPVATVPTPPIPVAQNTESSVPFKKKTGFLSSLLNDKKIKLVNEKESEKIVENEVKLSTSTRENEERESNTINTVACSLPTKTSAVSISVPEIQTTSQTHEPILSTKETNKPVTPVENTAATTTGTNTVASPTKTELTTATTTSSTSSNVQNSTAMSVTSINQQVQLPQPTAAATSSLLPSCNIEVINILPTTEPVIAPSLYYNNEFQLMVVPALSTRITNHKLHSEEQNEKRKWNTNHVRLSEHEQSALSTSERDFNGVWSNKWDVRFSPSTHLPHTHPMSKWNAKDV